MRKIYKLAGFICLGLVLSSQNTIAQTVSDFENLTLTPESYWDGSDLSGVYNAGTFSSVFTSGDFIFPNVFDTTWGAPGYWLSGFAYSNRTDSVTSGAGNKYSSRAGGGGSSSTNYAVAQNNSSILINNIGGFNAVFLEITNSTYAYNSMRDGDAFAKKFGGPTGNDPDWFKITIKDYSNGNFQDSLDFYLADFRFANNSQDYIIKDWNSIALPLTSNPIDSIYFELSSSDVGSFGMNTPGFFCIDNIVMTIYNNVVENKLNHFSFYPNPVSSILTVRNTEIIESVTVMDINGRTVINTSNLKSNQLKIDVEELKPGIYFMQVLSNGISQVQKFIKE